MICWDENQEIKILKSNPFQKIKKLSSHQFFFLVDSKDIVVSFLSLFYDFGLDQSHSKG
jgi:hypothetical protein